MALVTFMAPCPFPSCLLFFPPTHMPSCDPTCTEGPKVLKESVDLFVLLWQGRGLDQIPKCEHTHRD